MGSLWGDAHAGWAASADILRAIRRRELVVSLSHELATLVLEVLGGLGRGAGAGGSRGWGGAGGAGRRAWGGGAAGGTGEPRGERACPAPPARPPPHKPPAAKNAE